MLVGLFDKRTGNYTVCIQPIVQCDQFKTLIVKNGYSGLTLHQNTLFLTKFALESNLYIKHFEILHVREDILMRGLGQIS